MTSKNDELDPIDEYVRSAGSPLSRDKLTDLELVASLGLLFFGFFWMTASFAASRSAWWNTGFFFLGVFGLGAALAAHASRNSTLGFVLLGLHGPLALLCLAGLFR